MNNRPRVSMMAALVTVGAIAGAAIATAGPLSRTPERDPEHARLTAMCGTWHVEMTFWFKPASSGVTSNGTSTIRPLFDGAAGCSPPVRSAAITERSLILGLE